MKHIKVLAELLINSEFSSVKNKEMNVLYSDEKRKVVEVKLSNSEKLAKHSTPSPITVLCLSGEGVFRAGENLEEEQKLKAGTLLTLETGIEHEVIAQPEIQILVTKFQTVTADSK
jgi:quercetin dioxygenase-like cupin family protein